MKYLITLLFLITLSSPVIANMEDACYETDDFGECIEGGNKEYRQELSGVLKSFSNSLANETGGLISTESNSKWYLNLVRLRFRAFAKYSVPLLASIKVIPHLEFFWSRKAPKGWAPYRP